MGRSWAYPYESIIRYPDIRFVRRLGEWTLASQSAALHQHGECSPHASCICPTCIRRQSAATIRSNAGDRQIRPMLLPGKPLRSGGGGRGGSSDVPSSAWVFTKVSPSKDRRRIDHSTCLAGCINADGIMRMLRSALESNFDQ
jgi:hypothetical protein